MATELTWGNSGTYATLVDALNALPNPFVDDYKLLQVGDSIELAFFQFQFINFAGHELEITSDTPCLGNPNLGHVVNCDPGVNAFYGLYTGIPGNVQNYKIHGLRLIRTGTAGSAPNSASFFDVRFGGVGTVNAEIYENILDNANTGDSGATFSGSGAGSLKFCCNKIYGGKYYQVWLELFGTIFNLGARGVIENNTIDGQGIVGTQRGIGIPAGSSAVVKNNVCIRNDLADIEDVAVNTVARSNNATEDATGDGGLINIVPASEFRSLDDTNDGYLRLLEGAVTADWTREPAGDVETFQKIKFDPEVTITPGAATLNDGGIAPTNAVVDIRGLSIPNSQGEYPIGCHVQEYST